MDGIIIATEEQIDAELTISNNDHKIKMNAVEVSKWEIEQNIHAIN